MAQIHSFSHLHKICESAAKKTNYPLVLKELRRQVPRDWMPIAESTVLFFLPRAILDLPTKQARRAALDSIPNNTPVTNVRQFIEDGITSLWEKDRELGKGSSKGRQG